MLREASPDLDRTVAELRRSLPPRAPVLTVPSVRARDWMEVVRGVVLPLGLASSRFHVDWFGDYVESDRVMVRVLEGALAQPHQSALLPALEEAARSGASLAIASTDIDPPMLGMLLINSIKGTLRSFPLTPRPEAGRAALDALAGIAGAQVGTAGPSALSLGTAGTLPRLIATLDWTVVVGDLPSAQTTTIGLIHVGGEDIQHARARARSSRLDPRGQA
jgi:hypothetical protein